MKAVFALLVLSLALPAMAANVEGYVYSIDGTPVANATVTAYMAEGSADQLQRLESRATRKPLATAKVEEGRFALAGLPDSIVEIDVRADGFAPVVVRTLAGDLPLSVTLQPAPVIEGRVTAQGKPVANAYVVWTGANEVEYAATTDANGRYRVPEPRRWAHQPKVFHPSYRTIVDSGRGVESLHLELRPRTKDEKPAIAGNNTITGVVKLGDKPLAGVPLIIQGGGEQHIAAVRVVTDAKGRYTASGLTAARTYVAPAEGLEPRIRSSHSGRVEGDIASADLTKERRATLDLVLLKAPLIAGRVVDADGEPVAGAQLQVVVASRPTTDFMQDASARTMSDGRYAMAAPPFADTEMLQVAVFGTARSTVRSKSFSAQEADAKVDITLPRFETVTLRLVDRDRKPVSNARVAFTDSEEMLDVRMLLREPFVARAARGNDAGEVVLQLARSRYDFAVSAPGFQTTILEQQSIAGRRTIDVTLDPSFAIRGRVHRDGVAVPNVQVVLLDHERTMTDGDAPVATDAQGRFEVGGLARGKYRLGFYKHEELVQRTLAAEAPSTMEVPLPPAGTLRARVVDAATREPVREFVYSIEPLEPQEDDARLGSPRMHRGEANSDGRFVVTIPAGRYRVSAAATAYTASQPLEVLVSEREPAEVTIQLDRGITLTGRVTDDSGAPVEGAEVFVTPAEGDRANKRSAPRVRPGNGVSGADGTFTISGIEPGVATLMARKEGFVPFRKALDAGTETTLDIRLSRGLTLEGVVTRAGKPVADAQVSAMSAAVGGDHQPATTDRNGRFVLQGLVAARYTISAHREQWHAQLQDIDPIRQREIAISLDPAPHGVLFGTVTGMPRLAGKITRRAVFAHSDDRGAEGVIDEAGNYRIENAPTGNVTIVAQIESTTGGRSSQPRRIEVLPGQETRADLDLTGTATVSGRVTHEGKPVSGVRVVFADTTGVGSSSNTRPDGTYDASLPAAGTYQIFVHADGVASRPFQTVREIRGGETIDIDVREQTIDGTVVDALTGEPIAGAYVTLAPIGAPAESMTGETIADATGRFRILTAAAGPNLAIAWASGYAQRMQPITLGASRGAQLTFELERIEPLRVRVFDARTGTALESHLVVTTDAGAPVPVRPERSADGESFLFSLSRGRYRVTAVVHGYASKTVEVSAPGNAEIGM